MLETYRSNFMGQVFAIGVAFASAFLLCLLSVEPAVAADNVVKNPSAEEVAPDGLPTGWGLYTGAGRLRLSSSQTEKHSGRQSACLEMLEWHAPKDGKADAKGRHISGGIVLAPNNRYSAQGAIPCAPGSNYTFSFWYKGDVASATVGATGWPSADAGDKKRIEINVAGGTLLPGPEWKKCVGRFRIPDGVRCFVLHVSIGGQKDKGYALNKKIYIDDVAILPRAYPDGEIRALWGPLSQVKQRESGLREIEANLDKMKSGGMNTYFVLIESRYLAALDRPELHEAEPLAVWDALGELIHAAKKKNIQVHIWYSPWIYKSVGRGIELKDHPDWAAKSDKGEADPDGICLVRPEVRQYELDLLEKAIARYPDLAGIHIEEPGFNWGPGYCYCDHCRKHCLENFHLDICKDPEAARPTVHSLAAFSCTDFFIRLRAKMLAARPEMWLSANGGGGNDEEWYIGRDWHTWARRGLIDFYVPQLYSPDVKWFKEVGAKTKACLGSCDMVAGMAVSWSGIYPKKQPPALIAKEIAAARKLGAKGFCVYYGPFLDKEHYQGIREAVEEK
jgi:hypothetical protein